MRRNLQKHITFAIQESRRYVEKNIIFIDNHISRTFVEKKILGGIIQNHPTPAQDNKYIKQNEKEAKLDDYESQARASRHHSWQDGDYPTEI